MKTEQIIYLNDIAQTNSITQTAQRFFISQQALSATIKKLEDEFNTTFLTRTNKGVLLTENGKNFLEQAQDILDIYFKLKENFNYLDLATLNKSAKGEVSIFCHTRILGTVLIDILEHFLKQYPNIKIFVEEKENIDIIDGVSRQECDFGIIFVPDFLLDNHDNDSETKEMLKHSYNLPENIDLQVLFTDKFIICCSKQHAFAEKAWVSQQDLAGALMMLFDSNPLLNPHSKEEQTKIFSNNVQFHREMLLKGLAASCITSFEFRKLYLKYKNLTAIPMEDSLNSNITLVTNKEKTISPQTQLFIQLLKHYDFYRI